MPEPATYKEKRGKITWSRARGTWKKLTVWHAICWTQRKNDSENALMMLTLNTVTPAFRSVSNNLPKYRTKAMTANISTHHFTADQNKEGKLVVWEHAGKVMRCIDPYTCTGSGYEPCLVGRAQSVAASRSLFLPIPPQRITEMRSGDILSISWSALLTKQLAARFTTTDRLEQRHEWYSSMGSNIAYSNNL